MGIVSKIGAAPKRANGKAARSGRLAVALALAFAGGLSSAALAAGVDNPVDPVTGLALPLTPFEKVLPTADGKCEVITDPSETADRINFSWQGACRFGLAHGWGYGIDPADGRAVWLNFTYGWRDVEIPVPTGYAKIYSDKRNWGGGYTAVNFAGMDHFDPARYYDHLAAVQLVTVSEDKKGYEFVGLREFACPFKSFAAAPNYKPDKQQIALAKKACSKRKYDGATGYFIFEEHVTSIRDGAGGWAANASRVQNVRVCEPVPASDSVPTCEGEAIYAVAPLMDRINAVMAADKTAATDQRKELIARFAPLEVALNARIKAFAAAGNGR